MTQQTSLLPLIVLLTTTQSASQIPPPFRHNPNIPPSIYHGENQKFLTDPKITYYPPAPPPPPGFSPYGSPSYKDRTGIKKNEVKAGLGFWELLKNSHHHHHFGIQNSDQRLVTLDDIIRERYTTKIVPNVKHLKGPEAYNILEMTNYVTFDQKGVVYSREGTTTCISIYNLKYIIEWHKKQVEDFTKQFPNSVYPIFTVENYTNTENFTIYQGRIIHREPISITCCGSKEKLNLNFLTNGQHSKVNCIHKMGYIPIRKLVFFKLESNTDTSNWHEITVEEPKYSSGVTQKNNNPGSTEFFPKDNSTSSTTNTTVLPADIP